MITRRFKLGNRFGKNGLRLAIVLIITGAIGFYFEPFKPRFEGRTVRQWITYNAAGSSLPRKDVVRYFGAAAVPVLLKESQPSGLYSVTLALENVLHSPRFNALRYADFDRRMACADWAQMLLQLEPDVFTRLLGRTHNDAEALAMARLFYGERYVGETLEALSQQGTNSTLQARAGELLQVYRDAI